MYTSRECIEYLQENRKQNWSFDWSFEERKQRKAKESRCLDCVTTDGEREPLKEEEQA